MRSQNSRGSSSATTMTLAIPNNSILIGSFAVHEWWQSMHTGCLKVVGGFSTKKTECRMRNIKYIIMACILLHNLCIDLNDPCQPRWKCEVRDLTLTPKQTVRREDTVASELNRMKISNWLWSSWTVLHIVHSHSFIKKHVILIRKSLVYLCFLLLKSNKNPDNPEFF